MTKTLTCAFKDNLGNTGFLNIDEPIEGITPSEITEFMETVIEGDILTPNPEEEESYLTSIIGASYVYKLV